jgi:UDP-N-acetylmuramoyl-tripeptide--D-alanyl-D-alanine ligase
MATPIPSNRSSFTLGEVSRATAGALFANPGLAAHGVSIDSRTIEPGALFVALKGANHDGHQYLSSTLARGAAAAVVERGRRLDGLAAVEVDDTLAALGALARYHLKRSRDVRPIPSIAIGGAAGKTTTKEITAALAGALFGPTLWTPGNLNNLVGVPMTLLLLNEAHRAMVIECGTSARGEIVRLSRIVEPDVALVVNVDLEHTEGLGTLEEVADEEAALFTHSRRVAVIPANDERLARRVPAHLATLTFGAADGADVRVAERSIVSKGYARIKIRLAPRLVAPGVEPAIEAEVRMLGPAAALNCAAAVAAAAAALATPLSSEQRDAIAGALASVTAVNGRLSMKTVGGVIVIDDTYNANPRSLRVALAASREVAEALGARLVIALGDMLELGEFAKSAHADALREVFAAKPAAVVAVGTELSAALSAARASGFDSQTAAVHRFTDSTEAAGAVRGLVRAGDVLLVKGSRAIRMERIIDELDRRSAGV